MQHRRGLLLRVLLINFLLCFFFFFLVCHIAITNHGPVVGFKVPFPILSLFGDLKLEVCTEKELPLLLCFGQKKCPDPSLPQGTVRVARRWYIVSSQWWGTGPVLKGAVY